MRKEGAEIMESNYAFTGVGVAGMSWTLHAAAPAGHAAVAAHPAHAATGAAAAIPQRKRRTAATAPSVDRGTT